MPVAAPGRNGCACLAQRPTHGAVLTAAIYTLPAGAAHTHCTSSGLRLDVCITPQAPRLTCIWVLTHRDPPVLVLRGSPQLQLPLHTLGRARPGPPPPSQVFVPGEGAVPWRGPSLCFLCFLVFFQGAWLEGEGGEVLEGGGAQ